MNCTTNTECPLSKCSGVSEHNTRQTDFKENDLSWTSLQRVILAEDLKVCEV